MNTDSRDAVVRGRLRAVSLEKLGILPSSDLEEWLDAVTSALLDTDPFNPQDPVAVALAPLLCEAVRERTGVDTRGEGDDDTRDLGGEAGAEAA